MPFTPGGDTDWRTRGNSIGLLSTNTLDKAYVYESTGLRTYLMGGFCFATRDGVKRWRTKTTTFSPTGSASETATVRVTFHLSGTAYNASEVWAVGAIDSEGFTPSGGTTTPSNGYLTETLTNQQLPADMLSRAQSEAVSAGWSAGTDLTRQYEGNDENFNYQKVRAKVRHQVPFGPRGRVCNFDLKIYERDLSYVDTLISTTPYSWGGSVPGGYDPDTNTTWPDSGWITYPLPTAYDSYCFLQTITARDTFIRASI